MQRTFVLINRTTNEPDGVVSTYLDHLEDFDYNAETHELLTVEKDHLVFHEQLAWMAPRREVFGTLWDRQLTRKPQEQIDTEEQARKERSHPPRGPRDTDLLLSLVNELRAKNGDGPVALTDLRSKDVPADVVLPRSRM